MDVNAMRAAAAAGTKTGAAALRQQPDEGRPVISSDFETFLRMLTVQMQNQDPLNPMQSSDFAVQLATFSGVEQQVQTNQLLEQFISAQRLGGLGEAAGWVGREARAPVAARFDGAPVPVFADIPPEADQASLVVRDAAGIVITRTAFPPSEANLAWDGTDAGGAKAAPGLYTFTVELASKGKPLTPVAAEVYAEVTEVRLENGVPKVVFPGGEALDPDAITGLRLPAAG